MCLVCVYMKILLGLFLPTSQVDFDKTLKDCSLHKALSELLQKVESDQKSCCYGNLEVQK